jgi:PKD repeat protein
MFVFRLEAADQVVYLDDLEFTGGADFSASAASGDAPLTVEFTDESTGTPTAWAWDFDNDGETDSAEQNPTHIFSDPGLQTVKLIATYPHGSDDETKTNFISVTDPESLAGAWNDYD